MGTDSPVVALVGAGAIARLHANGWAELGVPLRVYSPHSARGFAARHPGALAVGSLAEAIDGADIADICSPTDTHEEAVLAAISAGLDVICEKPLARTTAQALGLQHAAKAAGRKLMPAHVVRWFWDYEAAHTSVSAGDLGELTHLRLTRIGPMPTPDWFHETDRSGGMVMDLMIHDMDQALWNAGPVAQVSGRLHPLNLDGSLIAELTLAHVSGATTSIEGTWGPPGTEFHTTFALRGSEGVLDHNSRTHRQGRIDARDARKQVDRMPYVISTSPYHLMLADFLSWHHGGSAPPVTAADGVAAVHLAEAALQAVSSGEVITV